MAAAPAPATHQARAHRNAASESKGHTRGAADVAGLSQTNVTGVRDLLSVKLAGQALFLGIVLAAIEGREMTEGDVRLSTGLRGVGLQTVWVSLN